MCAFDAWGQLFGEEAEKIVRAPGGEGWVRAERLYLSCDHLFDGLTLPERQVSNTMVDNIFTISPATKNAKFRMTNIANFLFTLESNSRRVRVTELRIDALNNDCCSRCSTPSSTRKPMTRV